MTTETIEGQEQTEEANAAAEQAAAQAAFSQMRGDEPAATDTTTDAPEKSAEEIEADNKAAEEALEQEAEQRWLEGAPKSVRESLTAISGVTGRLRNIEGHIGGLTSQTKELRTAMTAAKAAATAAGVDAPTDEQLLVALADPNSFQQWEEDMGEDFAKPIKNEILAIRTMLAKRGQAVDMDAVRNQVRDEVSSELQVDFLDTHRPEWKETLNKSEFRNYVLEGGPTPERYQEMKALEATDPAQAKAIQDEFVQSHPEWWEAKGRAFFSPKAKDAVKLLDGFSATSKTEPPANQPARQDPKARLAAAVTPTKASTAAPRRESITEEEAAAAAFRRVRTGS